MAPHKPGDVESWRDHPSSANEVVFGADIGIRDLQITYERTIWNRVFSEPEVSLLPDTSVWVALRRFSRRAKGSKATSTESRFPGGRILEEQHSRIFRVFRAMWTR